MKISVKSVQVMAADAGLPETLIERHMDALCGMALRLRAAERKLCQNKIRGWYNDRNLNKAQLFDILDD
jgi:hypothetical protein